MKTQKATKTTKGNKTTIRNLDPKLYRLARFQALREGITVAQFINQAIAKMLPKE